MAFAAAGGGQSGTQKDRRLMLLLGIAVLLVIVAVSVFAPVTANNDPRPSTYNTAPGGAKAAFLMLQSLHWPVVQWDDSLEALISVDAPRTTLVLAEPQYTALEKERLSAALRAFLERGGRALVTGSGGATLLPGGSVQTSRRLSALCYTEPEGPGSLARAGKVEMEDDMGWGSETPGVLVAQRCGPDAVVVRVPVGKGEAIWWSSASPLTNAELHNDADLRLLLASLGEGRQVLFDEALHQSVRSFWSATRGLPLFWMLGQSAVVFALLVFSFSRRRGPIRLPTGVPRSSPVEFAMSMGDLYERAGETEAATEAARRRLERVLTRDAGLAQSTVKAGAEMVAGALHARLGGTWSHVASHLQEATVASQSKLKLPSALKLVQALGKDAEQIQAAASSGVKPYREPENRQEDELAVQQGRGSRSKHG